MRIPVLFAVFLLSPVTLGQIAPEVLTVETLPEPGPNWFLGKTWSGGAHIFDAHSGEMMGMVSLAKNAPTLIANPDKREIYAAESYMTRETRGTRTDIVAIYDYDNLRTVAEIEVPNHIARLPVKRHLGLLNNGRHLAVLNMNPGHSVSIVDVEDRIFVDEISTPSCAVIMPVAESDFLQVCGDGTLQLIQLDLSGFQQNRERSAVFFNVIDDPVFDRVARSADGWILPTHSGMIYEVSTDDDEILIGEGWSLIAEGEESWRPGGDEFISAHQELGLLYVAMHEGGVDTHHQYGDEIWLFDLETRQRLHRHALEVPVRSLMVTQESNPKLIVSDEGGGTQVFDAVSFRHERSIETPASVHFEDF